jgi:Fic family protein
LYLSAYFEQDRDAYYSGLSAVGKRGAWQSWVEYFLKGVKEQSVDAASRLRQLADLRRSWHQRLARPRASASLLTAVDFLFERPIVTVPVIQDKLELKSYRGAKLIVEKLVQIGILQPIGPTTYGKTFYAAEVLAILS